MWCLMSLDVMLCLRLRLVGVVLVRVDVFWLRSWSCIVIVFVVVLCGCLYVCIRVCLCLCSCLFEFVLVFVFEALVVVVCGRGSDRGCGSGSGSGRGCVLFFVLVSILLIELLACLLLRKSSYIMRNVSNLNSKYWGYVPEMPAQPLMDCSRNGRSPERNAPILISGSLPPKRECDSAGKVSSSNSNCCCIFSLLPQQGQGLKEKVSESISK